MRKAQIQGQIFIYVLALIVVSLILLYGYNAIHDFDQRSNEVAMIKLQTALESAVKTSATDFRSVHKKTISVSGKYEQVCFLDLDFTGTPSGLTPNTYPIIHDSFVSKTKINVFLKPKDGISETLSYVGDIQVDVDKNGKGDDANTDGFHCFNVTSQGKINVKFVGTGKVAVVSEW